MLIISKWGSRKPKMRSKKLRKDVLVKAIRIAETPRR
jgi:hypothetical protein